MSKNFYLDQIISILCYGIAFLGSLYFLSKEKDLFSLEIAFRQSHFLLALLLSLIFIIIATQFIYAGIKALSKRKTIAFGSGVATWDFQFYPYQVLSANKRYTVVGAKAQVIGVNWITLGLLLLTVVLYLL